MHIQQNDSQVEILLEQVEELIKRNFQLETESILLTKK